MNKVLENRQREYWVDNVKILACILVVVGHFFQSMAKSDIISQTQFYEWFMQMIYYFHVPLFFICSGYLYQKLVVVNDIVTWKNNVLKKLLGLGIPYFTFSLITYFMKEIFSSSVNSQNGELVHSLFFKPMSPYWYLYALFFLFLVTPTLTGVRNAYVAIIVALIMKLVGIVCIELWDLPRFLEDILTYEVWFVLGMVLFVKGKGYVTKIEASKKRQIAFSIVVFVAFILITVGVYKLDVSNAYVEFVCGILACGSIILFFVNVQVNKTISEIGAKYTMPIYLMHTIFAAGFRSVLFKLGVDSAIIHIVVGLSISFVGPIIVTYIIKKTKYLEFFINPGKIVRLHK